MEGNNDSNQYLTFVVAKEVYGVAVAKVKEVLELIDITRVPKMPDFMRGVINLRGKVVPVIDLGIKFGLDEIQKSVDTCIVVLEIEIEDEIVTLGALTDAVREVVELDPQNIEPPPKIGTTLNTDFIRGMGKQDDSFTMILDIDRIFTHHDISALLSTQKQEAQAAS